MSDRSNQDSSNNGRGGGRPPYSDPEMPQQGANTTPNPALQYFQDENLSTGKRPVFVLAPGQRGVSAANIFQAFPYLPHAGLLTLYMRFYGLANLITYLRLLVSRHLSSLSLGDDRSAADLYAANLDWIARVRSLREWAAMVSIFESQRLTWADNERQRVGRGQVGQSSELADLVRQRLIDIGSLVDEALPEGHNLGLVAIERGADPRNTPIWRSLYFIESVLWALLDGRNVGNGVDIIADLQDYAYPEPQSSGCSQYDSDSSEDDSDSSEDDMDCSDGDSECSDYDMDCSNDD